MPYEILEWQDFSDTLSPTSTIILGNGASIAIDESFGYQSLLHHAQQQNLLDQDVSNLFQYFQTSDFELILRIVWQANNVNLSLDIPDNRTRDAYLAVRDSLIRAVQAVHPEYNEIREELPTIYNFLKQFDTVISLNYDLIIYWAMMHGMTVFDKHTFKDCFVHTEFQDDWSDFRRCINGETSTTLVFYPHGSLILARDIVEKEIKITRNSNAGDDLLNSILDIWREGNVVPLFVSEGTVEQKVNAIKGSYYLSSIYREVLQGISSDLIIYGWSMSNQDSHIIDRISNPFIGRIYVSVFRNDQVYCNRIYQLLHQRLGSNIEIIFFNSQSEGCWNN